MRYDRSLLYYVRDMKDTRARQEVTDKEKFAIPVLSRTPRRPDIYVSLTGQSVIDLVQ